MVGETLLNIPFEDIKSINLVNTNYLLQNTVKVETVNGDLNFRQFFNPKNAYALLNKVFDEYNKRPLLSNGMKASNSSFKSFSSPQKDNL